MVSSPLFFSKSGNQRDIEITVKRPREMSQDCKFSEFADIYCFKILLHQCTLM